MQGPVNVKFVTVVL